jgi:hypothetical protein
MAHSESEKQIPRPAKSAGIRDDRKSSKEARTMSSAPPDGVGR